MLSDIASTVGLTGAFALIAGGLGLAAKLFGWRWLWSVLSVSIPLPISVIALVAVFVFVDRETHARRMVDAAVTELVAGAEIARAEAERDIADELAAAAQRKAERAELRAEALERANRTFATHTASLAALNEEYENEIAALQANPAENACADISDDDLGRLRSNQP